MSTLHDIAAKIVIGTTVLVIAGGLFLGYKKMQFDKAVYNASYSSRAHYERDTECRYARAQGKDTKQVCDNIPERKMPPSSFWNFSSY